MSKLSLAVRLSGHNWWPALHCSWGLWPLSKERHQRRRSVKEADSRVPAPAQQGTSSQLRCHPTLTGRDHAPRAEAQCPFRKGSQPFPLMSITQPPLWAPTYLDFNVELFLPLQEAAWDRAEIAPGGQMWRANCYLLGSTSFLCPCSQEPGCFGMGSIVAVDLMSKLKIKRCQEEFNKSCSPYKTHYRAGKEGEYRVYTT